MAGTAEVRLPTAWVGAAAGLAAVAWAVFARFGGRSTPWFGITLGVAVGSTVFTFGAWTQRVRLEGSRLSGNVLLRRAVDLADLARFQVGGNPMTGGARSNDVAVLEDRHGGRVTIPLRTFPSTGRRAIASMLGGPVLASGVDLDDDARAFLDGV